MTGKHKYPVHKSPKCPVCSRPYIKTSRKDQAASRDHIYPRCYGSPVEGVINIRYMCVRCNGLRGTVGHCVGALACVLGAVGTTSVKPTTIIRRWKFHEVWTPPLKPVKKVKVEEFEIELERQLHGLGLSDTFY
jgi:hypothetical protein